MGSVNHRSKGSGGNLSKVLSAASDASENAVMIDYKDRLELEGMEVDPEYVHILQLQLPDLDPEYPVIDEEEEDSDPIDSAEDESDSVGDDNPDCIEEVKGALKGGKA